ncbi:hypothetical protein EHS13_33135 [Paenibacillus psychroresistens]|uniref:DUF4328 domain-containing protein n=1 Tax=Paenibacillus psychroresistens TaxID=1778678 RepID=A0A6B8RUC9_9BACL|nr:hypothetical protein [Paenibacillus psychroresistens]QGQ99364.1 hypothetical protein EHS13_33135 [Paenibacillus psychroresistens]
MKLKSEMVSSILRIMLWALVTLTTLNLLATIIYAVDTSFYMDSIYSINSFINSLSTVLYILIIVIYLIWIYRVHMDLVVIFPSYPRSSGSALACSMIPIYSFYGLPSTYLMIGEHFQNENTGAQKQGRWISGLAVPMIISLILINLLNRLVTNSDGDANVSLLLVSNVAELSTHIMFLSLCIFVAKGLQLIHFNSQIPKSTYDINPEWVSVIR